MKSAILTRRLGFFAALVCAIHCLALPLLSLSLSVLEDTFLHHPITEIALVIFGIMVGAYILPKDYSYHKKKIPMILAVLGLSLQIVSLFLQEDNVFHRIFSIVGALLLLCAYISNWQFSRKCKKH